MKKIKNYFIDLKHLLRSVPGVVTALFCMSVVLMNLLANKTILNSKFVSLDGGFLLSWLPFLCMDMITKRFGYRAANKLTVFALVLNLLFVGIFAIVAATQIDIGPEYQQGDQYAGFNSVFGGTWFVLLSSSLAFLLSGIINNISNYFIGRQFKNNPDGKLAYVTRTYISTFIGQFIDNLIFQTLVFTLFAPIYWGFGWTFVQCLGAAIVGAMFELIMEILFSSFGYKISKKWASEGVGQDYIDTYVKEVL